MSTENALLTILVEKIKNDSLVLPTLPEIAVKVRECADDPDANLAMMADVIAHDPALSARMLKIANSAYIGRSVKVETLNQAVTRIGLRQIKNIATALAMEQLFVSKNDLVKAFMDKVWKLSIEVASVSMALMKAYLVEHKHTSLNLDTITLATLVHNIGVLPILTEAERHEEVFANQAFLEGAIARLAGRIGGSIMRSWEFSDDFIEIAEKWNDLSHEHDEPGYLDFIRVAAVYCDVLPIDDEKVDFYQEYVDKGILSSTDFIESEEFLQAYNDAKTVFA
ncbi:HDOD domain-containing protein [Catenovulum sp. SM1970]|uniref:HDOD domain-containing protein n=1 Tax=Marinifaba aquimaris TaxID=2741323 RepID=UPI0015732FAB|nr:HDOD domain-containing protein [Marinifaba aquimaris]NTS77000.1 HDOD domain-containing protein [Marinifaba aquimaris]